MIRTGVAKGYARLRTKPSRAVHPRVKRENKLTTENFINNREFDAPVHLLLSTENSVRSNPFILYVFPVLFLLLSTKSHFAYPPHPPTNSNSALVIFVERLGRWKTEMGTGHEGETSLCDVYTARHPVRPTENEISAFNRES